MTLSQDPPILHPVARIAAKTSLVQTHSLGYTPLSSQLQPIRLPGTDCTIKPLVSLAGLTSFRVGGPAELYVAPRTTHDLQLSLQWAIDRGLPITYLGAGSNLLVSDQGLPGLVIGTRHLRHLAFDEKTNQLTAASGEPIPRLAWQAASRGWSGLEWAVGIPGTLGGAVVMNAGAHSHCMANFLVNVQVLNSDGTIESLTPEALGYSYRSSLLQASAIGGSPRLVVQATLQLQPGTDPDQLLELTTAHLNQRRNSQPYHLPSCGSVFRNPLPHKAGWLIEQTGLKGYQIGGAQIAHRHANFILNCGSATAMDIFHLIQHVQQRVQEQWSLHLEPEVKMLGEFPAT